MQRQGKMSGIFDQWSSNDNIYGHGIISKNCMVRKVSEPESAVQYVRAGTFVQVHCIRDDSVYFYVVSNDMQVEGDQLICTRSDVVYVPENLWGPLFPVEQSVRLSLVEDSKVAEIMGNISVGHRVQVLGSDNKTICTGTVTFRNSIARLGVGVYFGLRIETIKENFQAIVQNVSLLEPGTKGFPRGCDIVVSVDKICPKPIKNNQEKVLYHFDKEIQEQSQSQRSPVSEEINGTGYKSTSLTLKDKFLNCSKKILHNHHHYNQINNPCSEPNLNYSSTKKATNCDIPLSVGDKVVYLDGETPEKGVVKWIGYLKSRLKVGVEFENPIGNGGGIFEGIELFKAKRHHASFIPPMALIKLSDYMTNNTNDAFLYKNNMNCKNNNNNNNNNIYNNLRSNDLYCNKISNEEKFEVVKSNSHHCLKHSERTFYCDDFLQGKKEPYSRRHICVTPESMPENNCEVSLHQNSRSFDLSKLSERKNNCRRQCNSVDNDLLDVKEYKSQMNCTAPANLGHRTPSEDLFDLMGPNWAKQSRNRSCQIEEKLNRDSDDSAFSLKGASNQIHEDLLNLKFEKDVWNSHYSEHSSSNESIPNFYDAPKPTTSFAPDDFSQGSVVELTYKGEPHYGVIRWIGIIPDYKDHNGYSLSSSASRLIAGIEMEEEENGLTDGTYNNKRYFQCNSKKALFIPLSKCRKDSRFSDEAQKQLTPTKINYGQIDCPVVEGTIPPIHTKGDIQSICGKNRGIQGHHNSCYLDATLFSMFAFTCVFDSLLFRPPTKQDIPQYLEVQRVLREEIVNPLRKNLYVRADRVMKLRTLLDKLSSVSGLTSEEKDPEEFLNSLLAQILKAEPFLKLSSGQEAFHHQLFVEKDERLTFPSVQQLFEQSFVTSDIKLKQVPPCLIIQMPRFGKSFKMYSKILPPQLLDVTDVIENSPRQCTVCGKSAEYECKDCFGQTGIGNGLESISFCKICLETAHNHHCRTRHNYKPLTVPDEFSELQEHCVIPRVYMELFAVVCIETSHYVAFVKCGSGSDAPWCFFDSMADRKGEQNGYNIPEMVACPELPYWLSEDGAKTLNEMRDEHHLPEHAKRLFSDAYMCMYQSPDMMMYR